jgi:hypothetical protein
VSDEKTKLTPADAVRIVEEVYEALRERVVMIMDLPEFSVKYAFGSNAFCLRAELGDDRSIVVEWYDAQEYYFETREVCVPAELFEMSRDDFVLHKAMLDRQHEEAEAQRKREREQAVEVREHAEFERLRAKFEGLRQ